MSYPQANCRISGGPALNIQRGKLPLTTFAAHNFVHKVDLLLPKKLYPALLSSSPKLFEEFKCYKLNCTIGKLLSEPLLNLIRTEDVVVKLMSCSKREIEPVVCSIVNNQLCLSLDRSNSLQTGISMKKSQFKGVERFNLVVDLTKPELVSDLSFLKVLKFLQDFDQDETSNQFVLSVYDKLYTPIEISQDLYTKLSNCYDTFTELVVSGVMSEMQQVAMVDLQIVKNDPDWGLEVLEYLTYLSIGGQQLTQPVDSFLSQYRDSMEFISKEDVVKITFESLLVPSACISSVFINHMKDLTGWFAILSHGVTNVNYSFGFSEHLFHENGENSTCYLQNNGEYVLWEIVGGRDNY